MLMSAYSTSGVVMIVVLHMKELNTFFIKLAIIFPLR